MHPHRWMDVYINMHKCPTSLECIIPPRPLDPFQLQTLSYMYVHSAAEDLQGTLYRTDLQREFVGYKISRICNQLSPSVMRLHVAVRRLPIQIFSSHWSRLDQKPIRTVTSIKTYIYPISGPTSITLPTCTYVHRRSRATSRWRSSDSVPWWPCPRYPGDGRRRTGTPPYCCIRCRPERAVGIALRCWSRQQNHSPQLGEDNHRVLLAGYWPLPGILVIVLDTSHCIGHWLLPWILTIACDTGHCIGHCLGYWPLPTILAIALDTGHCLGYWPLPRILVTAWNTGHCIGYWSLPWILAIA